MDYLCTTSEQRPISLSQVEVDKPDIIIVIIVIHPPDLWLKVIVDVKHYWAIVTH